MDCPRCDRQLERYALGGREAVSCDACGYIGVPVEHRGEFREVESWDDAVSRFHEVDRVQAGTVETSGDTPPVVDPAGNETVPEPTVVRIETPGTAVDVGSEANGEADGLVTNGEADGLVTNGETEPDEGVSCDVCGKRFERRVQLHGHSAVHSDREE